MFPEHWIQTVCCPIVKQSCSQPLIKNVYYLVTLVLLLLFRFTLCVKILQFFCLYLCLSLSVSTALCYYLVLLTYVNYLVIHLLFTRSHVCECLPMYPHGMFSGFSFSLYSFSFYWFVLCFLLYYVWYVVCYTFIFMLFGVFSFCWIKLAFCSSSSLPPCVLAIKSYLHHLQTGTHSFWIRAVCICLWIKCFDTFTIAPKPAW